MTARELAELSSNAHEVTWTRGLTRSDTHPLAMVVLLKYFQHLGYFSRHEQVPEVIIDYIRRQLEVSPARVPELGQERTVKLQQELLREHVGALFNPKRAHEVASQAIREATSEKHHPRDLINVTLELLPSRVTPKRRPRSSCDR